MEVNERVCVGQKGSAHHRRDIRSAGRYGILSFKDVRLSIGVVQLEGVSRQDRILAIRTLWHAIEDGKVQSLAIRSTGEREGRGGDEVIERRLVVGHGSDASNIGRHDPTHEPKGAAKVGTVLVGVKVCLQALGEQHEVGFNNGVVHVVCKVVIPGLNWSWQQRAYDGIIELHERHDNIKLRGDAEPEFQH